MNIINEKLKKLDSLKKKEKEYLIKMKEKQKKLQDEINLFRKKTNISEEGLSQIKQNNLSEKELSFFFSEKSASEIGSNFKDLSNNNKDLLSEVLSINEFDSNNSNNSKITKGIKKNNEKIGISDNDLYSIKSRESLKSKKTYGRNRACISKERGSSNYHNKRN